MTSAAANNSRIGRSIASPGVATHLTTHPQRKATPAIKQVPDRGKASSKEYAAEIEALQKLIQLPLALKKINPGGVVLRVRGGEEISEAQARAAGFRLVSSGKPGHGVILHYGQLHSVEIPGFIASAGAPYAMGGELKSKVIQCQRKIFDELLTSGIKHVFVEGYEQTLVPDEFVAGSDNANARDKIRARFHGYRPGDRMSLDNEELLYAGGDQIYGHLVAGVTLHSTITPAQVARHDAYYNGEKSRARFIANKFSAPQQDRALFFDEVEQILMGKMKQVMQGRSLNVALAIGRDHAIENLAAYCKEADFSPAIYSKDAST